MPDAHPPALMLLALTLALMFCIDRYLPRLPAPLVAVAVGIAAAALLGFKDTGVALVGTIPPGLPSPALPDFSLVHSLWAGALGIALMSFTESVAAGRAFARPDDLRPSPDRELLALGAANLAAGRSLRAPRSGLAGQIGWHY
jgi:MFS superfamily sulfate permease-like transporter